MKVSDVDFHKREDCEVVKHAPLAGLDVIESEEDAVHSLAVETVVELEQIDIVKDTEVIEGRRNDSSCSWDGDNDVKVIDELREELSFKVVRKVSHCLIVVVDIDIGGIWSGGSSIAVADITAVRAIIVSTHIVAKQITCFASRA